MPDRNLDYSASHFLTFGDPQGLVYETRLDPAGARDYLAAMGMDNGALTQARRLRHQHGRFVIAPDENDPRCDFCGHVLSGVEYEKLRDGRDRCVSCSRTVVKGQQAVEALFFQVKAGLTEKFGINLPTVPTVKVVSQDKLSRALGEKFVPTKNFDPRAVGVATNRRGQFGIMLENGAPRLNLIATSAHELTHIWQYSTWNWEKMEALYGDSFLAVCEGMAKWAELQYLFLINEAARADEMLLEEAAREDVYGYGLRLYLNRYPMSRGVCLEGDTPFDHPEEPLDL